MTTATARANSNIALIKYWGKKDAALSLPTTSSLSLTLADTWTTTTVSFEAARPGGTADAQSPPQDEVVINGRPAAGAARCRVVRFLDLVRERAGMEAVATVRSTSTVPVAAGLASSAAGFAALAGAASRAAGLELEPRELSRLARRGSGSATRSVFGGLVRWNAGHDDASSYAEPVECSLDLAMVMIVLSGAPKAISSTEAMERTIITSPLYEAWVRASAADLEAAQDAARTGDLEHLGRVAEGNALGMHASMMAARPGIVYWQPGTVAALHAVAALREQGLPAWATIDAGPNVKVLTCGDRAQTVAAHLRQALPDAHVTVHPAGPGLEYVEDGGAAPQVSTAPGPGRSAASSATTGTGASLEPRA